MSLITIIGRGHGGTRAISHTLYASGVFMGNCQNRSGDKIPPQQLYDACRVMAKYVEWKGGLNWDFDTLNHIEIDPEFVDLINAYLDDVLNDSAQQKGWKLPETTLIYPWISRMFPDAKYIHWLRDPRDSIISGHKTDDLSDFGIKYPRTDDIRRRRAISWKYQYELMKATPRPSHCIDVRFEDFVMNQEVTLTKLESFLGIPLGRIVVRPESVGRWKIDKENHTFDFLSTAMTESGYGI
ncbi:MAG: sulfotransferase [Candidatus Latescibacterota bacterium]|nr:sulfotransferase [Candidatus Latescibacterota bacterium]